MLTHPGGNLMRAENHCPSILLLAVLIGVSLLLGSPCRGKHNHVAKN
jgi:hypothetical protein